MGVETLPTGKFRSGYQGLKTRGKHAIFSVKRFTKEIARRWNGGENPKGREAVAAVRTEIEERLGLRSQLERRCPDSVVFK